MSGFAPAYRAMMWRAALLIALFAVSMRAGSDVVIYNPYAGVDWNTFLRCLSQHHDHISSAGRVHEYDAAGYDAVMFMDYSGRSRPSTLQEWQALGSPGRDPGQPVGWTGHRRWPPTDHGAPSPLTLTNIKFYIPGAEEVGLLPDGGESLHVHSAFLETYVEGAGCESCGVGGIPVARNKASPINPAGLPDDQRYWDSQGLIDRINFHGGHATLNHPDGLIAGYASLDGIGSVEIFNNFMALRDEGDGGSRSASMLANWDALLETKSSKIWGIAVNDWFGAWVVPRPAAGVWPALTDANLDRGKLQVLVTSYDLPAYRAAFEAGAFFAVIDGGEFKGGYPQVMGITVNADSINLATAGGDEVVTWIGNGEIVGSGMSLWLDDLPSGLKYVRAEIDDLQGRRIFTQPFSLDADQDGDSVGNSIDNCALIPNTDQQDTDQDGSGDLCDNCIEMANGVLIPDTGINVQLDTDGDGFGNICDGDFNQDDFVNSLDLGTFKQRFFTTDPDADLNGDGFVNSLDLGRFKQMFFDAPGPSGIAP